MGRFTPYNLVLKSLSEGSHHYDYLLDDKFFEAIDDEQVRKGKIKVNVTVKRTGSHFEITFLLDGNIQIPCDRCLDDMTLPITVEEFLIVKFGADYAEEGENIVIIPEAEGELNIAWFLFEFVALAIPIKHIHPPGQCNKEMSSKLRKHSARKSDDDDDDLGMDETPDDLPDTESSTDPRWDGLKQLLDN